MEEEVEGGTKVMEYRYYMTQRPPMPGAMPRHGLEYVADFGRKIFCYEISREAYGCIGYNRELTEKEISDYELTAQKIRLED